MRPGTGGFTLIELLVTIAVAAILLTVGVPGFQTLFNRNRVATATNDFIASANYARSAAVANSQVTTICMSNNQTSCTGNSGWTNGWIVSQGGTVLRVHGPLNAGDAVIGGGTQTSFAFNAQGALTSAAGGDTLNVCTPSDLSLSRQIVVGAAGLVSSRAPASALSTCP